MATVRTHRPPSRHTHCHATLSTYRPPSRHTHCRVTLRTYRPPSRRTHCRTCHTQGMRHTLCRVILRTYRPPSRYTHRSAAPRHTDRHRDTHCSVTRRTYRSSSRHTHCISNILACDIMVDLIFSKFFLMHLSNRIPEFCAISLHDTFATARYFTFFICKESVRLVSDRLGHVMERNGVLLTTPFASQKCLGTLMHFIHVSHTLGLCRLISAQPLVVNHQVACKLGSVGILGSLLSMLTQIISNR